MRNDDVLKIVGLIKEYQKNQRIADEEFCKRLVAIVTASYELENYVEETIVIPKGKEDDSQYEKYMEGLAGLFGQAAYEEETKKVIVYERNIQAFRLSEVKSNQISDTNLGVNLLIAQSLLHELQHALQQKQVIEGNDLESELLRSITFEDPETNASYECSPFERMAEIQSLEIALEILKHIPVADSKLFEYLEGLVKEKYQGGYEFVSSDGNFTNSENGIFTGPFEQYIMLHHGSTKNIEKLVSRMDSSKKLLYGITIPLEEYQEYTASDFKRK